MPIPFPVDTRRPDRRTVSLFIDDCRLLPKSDQHAYFFYFFEDGFAEVQLDGTHYFCSAPALLCLNEKQVLQVERDHPLKSKTVIFLPEFINRNMTLETIYSKEYAHLCDDHDLLMLRPFIHSDFPSSFINGLSPDMTRLLAQELTECKRQITEQPDWYWSCRARSCFLECLHMAERLYYRENQDVGQMAYDCHIPEDMQELKGAIELIWGNYADKELTANAIVSTLHTNKETLNKQFKSVLDTSIYQYILEYRLAVAAKKLRFTSLTVDEIAHTSGFGSAANFSTIFKKKQGLSPSDFRTMVVEKRKLDF